MSNGVFPACAGMILRNLYDPPTMKGVPRMRGDDPALYDGVQVWPPVFPACAGMIPPSTPCAIFRICVPRMRGDDPQWKDYGRTYLECSPHARG